MVLFGVRPEVDFSFFLVLLIQSIWLKQFSWMFFEQISFILFPLFEMYFIIDFFCTFLNHISFFFRTMLSFSGFILNPDHVLMLFLFYFFSR